MSFSDFDLAPEFVEVYRKLEYQHPTPVQAQTIPVILEGHDLIACAETGSGKTAAFMLPILTQIAAIRDAESAPPRGPMALVLVPTRELAGQVVEASEPFAAEVDLAIAAVYGGVSMRHQIEALRRGVDVLVATPGRLLDHMASGRIDYADLEFLVLDEGDRMLDIGFLPDIRRIAAHLPLDRQTLLFSATMPHAVEGLANSLTRDAKHVRIGEAGGDQPQMPDGITHAVFLVNPRRKVELMLQLLVEEGTDSVLVFTRTRAGADILSRSLGRSGIDADRIHGDLDQRARQKALDAFKQGKHQVLVATDVAARGLDIEGISHVINYDFPPCAEDYIHRVGRTGRADATGDAFSLVTPEEWNTLLAVEQAIGMAIPRLERNGLTYSVSTTGGPAFGPRHRRSLPRRW